MTLNPENTNGKHPLIELFTDGSCCHGDLGPGGWAFILRHSASGIERVVSGGIGYTSSERMEMIAIINGLRSLKRACRVTVFSDSKGVIKGIAERVTEWKRLGWRKSVNSKKYVNNADLWMHLVRQCARHTVEAKWVKGHAGHPENERCDKLARQEARKAIENLECSAQKTGAGADSLLADWVSAEVVPPASRPAMPPSPKPVVVKTALARTPALQPQLKPPASKATLAKVERPVVDLFTDGACAGNPGPGGWAFILRHRASKLEKTASGGMAGTTNNRMELLAVIQGLSALKKPCQVHLFTDSQYVSRGISEWSPKWKSFGWRKTINAKERVPNADLWTRLDELCAGHTIVPQWVRAHAGHPENERCDQLAERAAQANVKNPGSAPVDVKDAG